MIHHVMHSTGVCPGAGRRRWRMRENPARKPPTHARIGSRSQEIRLGILKGPPKKDPFPQTTLTTLWPRHFTPDWPEAYADTALTTHAQKLVLSLSSRPSRCYIYTNHAGNLCDFCTLCRDDCILHLSPHTLMLEPPIKRSTIHVEGFVPDRHASNHDACRATDSACHFPTHQLDGQTCKHYNVRS